MLTAVQSCVRDFCPTLPSAGVPGPVNPTVEPFTKDSVRITWDPPAEPNDDIELLHYNVYYEIRNFSEPQTFSIAGHVPEQMLSWNERSVLVSGASHQSFIVAYVVAVSANGMGAVTDEQSYGITYGNSELCGYVCRSVKMQQYCVLQWARLSGSAAISIYLVS